MGKCGDPPALRRLGVDIQNSKVGHANTRTVTLCFDPAKAGETSSASSAADSISFDEMDLSADDPPAATSSADRPQPKPPSARSSPATLFADDVSVPADDVQTIPSSALNSQSHKEVKWTADDADDVCRPFRTDRQQKTTAFRP